MHFYFTFVIKKILDYQEHVQSHLICDLLLRKFPYVSYVSGGFQHCHDLVKQYNLELNDHYNKKTCYHCNFTDVKNSFPKSPKNPKRLEFYNSIKSSLSVASKLRLLIYIIKIENKFTNFLKNNFTNLNKSFNNKSPPRNNLLSTKPHSCISLRNSSSSSDSIVSK